MTKVTKQTFSALSLYLAILITGKELVEQGHILVQGGIFTRKGTRFPLNLGTRDILAGETLRARISFVQDKICTSNLKMNIELEPWLWTGVMEQMSFWEILKIIQDTFMFLLCLFTPNCSQPLSLSGLSGNFQSLTDTGYTVVL